MNLLHTAAMAALPPFDALIAFEATLRNGSVTAAAKDLGRTQSAVSHRLRRLEAFMGTALLARTGNGIKPTAAGTALADGLTELLGGLAELRARCRAATAPASLKVGVGSALADHWLVARLPRFTANHDDVAVEKSTYTTGRRGVAGTLIVEKMVGAAAENGMPLAALKVFGDEINRRTRSMGVALLPCTVPAAGRPNFTLADDEMEMGVGIHGEPGRRRVSLAPADAIADELVGAILKDLAPKPGSEVLLLVNGFGATPLIELYLMVNSAKRILDGAGLKVTRFLTGSYVTSLDMAGASVTVSVLDGQTKELWDAPVHTAALRWAC